MLDCKLGGRFSEAGSTGRDCATGKGASRERNLLPNSRLCLDWRQSRNKDDPRPRRVFRELSAAIKVHEIPCSKSRNGAPHLLEMAGNGAPVDCPGGAY
jgi:hypothetical protein